MEPSRFSITIRYLISGKGIFQSISEAAIYLGAYTADKFTAKCESTKEYSQKWATKEYFKSEIEYYDFCMTFLFVFGVFAGIVGIVAFFNDARMWSIILALVSGTLIAFGGRDYNRKRLFKTEYHYRVLELKYSIDADHIADAILWAQKTQRDIVTFWEKTNDQLHGIRVGYYDYNVKNN